MGNAILKAFLYDTIMSHYLAYRNPDLEAGSRLSKGEPIFSGGNCGTSPEDEVDAQPERTITRQATAEQATRAEINCFFIMSLYILIGIKFSENPRG
jgi:hypothetical protein